jgi:hypothetical protein
MPQALTDEIAVTCFYVFRAWFGPPPAEFRSELLDGRVRVRVCTQLGVKPPRPVVLEHTEAALRWLLVAGHVTRACDLAEASGVVVDDLLPVRLGLPPFIVATAIAERKRRTHRSPARSRGEQVRLLLQLAQAASESNTLILPEDIRAVCG